MAQIETAIFRVPLGSADHCDRSLLRRLQPPKGSFGKGDLYLQLTIDELDKMVPKCRDANIHSKFEADLDDAKARYDVLLKERNQVEQTLSSTNPWKRFWEGRRESREFMKSAADLYLGTKRTSDEIKRTCVSVPSAEISPVADGSISPGEPISGVSVPLNGPFNDEMASTLCEIASFFVSQADTSTDPFADGTGLSVSGVGAGSSDRSVDGSVDASSSSVRWSTSARSEVSSTSSGSRPTTQNFYLLSNSIIAAPQATVSNPTVNNGGKNNRGGIVYQQVVIPAEPPDNNTSPPLTASLCEHAGGDDDTLQISV